MKTVKSLFLVLFFSVIAIHWAQSQPTKPYQFIAKIWTEALGRIPDPARWKAEENNIVNSFYYYQNIVREVYKCPEFYDDYPTTDTQWKQSRLLALYRGGLNREPDQTGFASYLSYMEQVYNQGGRTWNQVWELVVDGLTVGTEFNNLVSTIISRANIGLPYYGWGLNSPILVNTTPGGTKINFNGTQARLQAILDSLGARKINGTVIKDSVTLAPMAVIEVTTGPIHIPENITLTTAGSPSHFKYAKMARFVKMNTINSPMLTLSGKSILKNVWVDGSFGRVNKDHPGVDGDDACVVNKNDVTNIQDELKILNNRFTDASGSNFIKLHTGGNGTNNLRRLDIAEVKYNLITAYSTSHMGSGDPWTEGIDISLMKNGLISENQIVDITDGAICLFNQRDTTNTYYTLIQFNQILNAGNSAVAGIVFDTEGVDGPKKYKYNGAIVHNNVIWTSPTAHIDRVFHIGCWSEWEYEVSTTWSGEPDIASGGTFQNNSSGVNSITAEVGLKIDGINGVTISNNSLSFRKTEAFHSRINSTYAIYPSSVSTGTPATTQYQFASFVYDPFGMGSRSLLTYISGPDSIYRNESVSFKVENLTNYVATSFNWVAQYQNGAHIMEFTPSPGATLTFNTNALNLTTNRWIRIRFFEDGERYTGPWKTKFVKYNHTLLKQNSNESLSNTKIDYDYSLSNNYPNPFNPSTTINYSLKEKGLVKLNVYDMLGQEVAVLVNKYQEAGKHYALFNATDLPSGVYIYKLHANGFSDSKKLLLIK